MPLQGTDVTDEELLEYISESSTMSKAMDEYDGESPPFRTFSQDGVPLHPFDGCLNFHPHMCSDSTCAV